MPYKGSERENECNRKANEIYRKTHKEKIREKGRKYYQTHKEKWKEKNRIHHLRYPEYYQQYKDEILKQEKEYYQTNRERCIKECAKWKREHPELRKKHELKHNAKRRNLGFVPFNESFKGAVAHHIDLECVIYIPKELHRSVYHNIRTNKGMTEINDKVFVWLDFTEN